LKENNRKLASQMEAIMKRGEDLEKENESLNTELSKEAMKAIRLEVDKKEKMVHFGQAKSSEERSKVDLKLLLLRSDTKCRELEAKVAKLEK